MADVGNLYIKIMGNGSHLSATLSRSQREIQGFASTAKNVLLSATGLGAFASGAGLVYGIKQAADAAKIQEDAERKLESVLRSTGGAAGYTAGELKGYAAELQRVTNYGDEATISAMAVMASFTQVRGDVFKEAISSAQDLSSVLGQDLQASVVQIGKALNDPTTGATALRRVGVSFSPVQMEDIKRLQEAGDLLGAQRMILRELQTEFGGAAEAMANPLTQAKNAMGDMAESIVGNLLPYLHFAAEGMKGIAEAGQGIAAAPNPFDALGQGANAFHETMLGVLDVIDTVKLGIAWYNKEAANFDQNFSWIPGVGPSQEEVDSYDKAYQDALTGPTTREQFEQNVAERARKRAKLANVIPGLAGANGENGPGEAAQKEIEKQQKLLDALSEKADQAKFGDDLRAQWQRMYEAGKVSTDTFAKALPYIQQAEEAATSGKIRDIFGRADDMVRDAGVSGPFDKMLTQLQELVGSSDPAIARLRGLAQQYRDIKNAASAAAEAQQRSQEAVGWALGESKTPLDAFREEMAKAAEAAQVLGDAAVKPAIAKATQRFMEAGGQAQGPQYAQGAAVGSAEAYKLIASALTGANRRNDTENLLRQANEIFAANFPDMREKLQKIVDEVEKSRLQVAGAM